MSRLLHRLGHSTAAHPWRTISAWLVLAVAVVGLAAAFGGTPHDNWDIPGAQAQRGIEQLREHTPGAGNASARVVVHDRGGAPVSSTAVTSLTTRLAAMDHVVGVSAPRTSDDGDTALLTVQYDVPVTDDDLMGNLAPLEKAVAPTRDNLQVELGGELPDTAAAPMKGQGELIGIVVALFILVLVFGSVVGAGLPVAVALLGLGVGSAGIALLAATTDVSTSAPTVATMVGLGVGIDYALLLVTRHVEFLRIGLDKREAAGRAVATAGRSVVFAAATVLISLLGLKLAGLPTYDSFGYATAIAVLAVASAALTLVPALCGLAGHRLLPRRVRQGRERTGTPIMSRWATRVARRPLAWALASVVVLLTLAAPALAMRTWPQDSSAQSSDLTTRKAYDLVADEYGPGANGPIMFVAPADRVSGDAVAALAAQDRVPRRRGDGVTRGDLDRRRPAGLRGGADLRPDRRPHPRPGRRPAPPGATRRRGHREHAAVLRHRHDAGDPAVARRRLRRRGLGPPARPGVPLGHRPGQGGADEPALHRGGVRRGHGGLPVGLGSRACSASTTRCRSRAGSRS